MAIKQDVVYEDGKFDLIPTGKNVLGASLGVGQKWVLQSYTSGTTYTNTTNQPIYTQISTQAVSDSIGSLMLTVDGLQLSNNSPSQNTFGFVQAIIPPGSKYEITSSNITSLNWAELVSQTDALAPAILSGTTIEAASDTQISELASVGYRQAWSEPSRTKNTVYQNLTSRPIAVNITVSWTGSAVGQPSAGILKVDGLPVYSASMGTGPLLVEFANYTAIVPPGSTYEFDITVPDEQYLLVKWYELSDTGALAKPIVEGSADMESIVPGDITPATSIGIGQKWSDISADFVKNKAYTNSTGRPIMISGYGSNQVVGAFWQVDVDSLIVMKTAIQAVPDTNHVLPFITIVPNGSTYIINTSSAMDTIKVFQLS